MARSSEARFQANKALDQYWKTRILLAAIGAALIAAAAAAGASV